MHPVGGSHRAPLTYDIGRRWRLKPSGVVGVLGYAPRVPEIVPARRSSYSLTLDNGYIILLTDHDRLEGANA